MPLKTRRVPQEPLYGTARPFRTPGSPLRYRMLPRQKGERPCLRRIPQTARKEKTIAKSAARNAAASKKITAKKFAMPPKATPSSSVTWNSRFWKSPIQRKFWTQSRIMWRMERCGYKLSRYSLMKKAVCSIIAYSLYTIVDK